MRYGKDTFPSDYNGRQMIPENEGEVALLKHFVEHWIELYDDKSSVTAKHLGEGKFEHDRTGIDCPLVVIYAPEAAQDGITTLSCVEPYP